jgi:hypothetical protein
MGGQLAGTALTIFGYAVGTYLNVPQLGALFGDCCGTPIQLHEPQSAERSCPSQEAVAQAADVGCDLKSHLTHLGAIGEPVAQAAGARASR